MGGRYAKGARKGSWAKAVEKIKNSASGPSGQQLQKIKKELIAQSSLEKEAALAVAKALALKVESLTALNRLSLLHLRRCRQK